MQGTDDRLLKRRMQGTDYRPLKRRKEATASVTPAQEASASPALLFTINNLNQDIMGIIANCLPPKNRRALTETSERIRFEVGKSTVSLKIKPGCSKEYMERTLLNIKYQDIRELVLDRCNSNANFKYFTEGVSFKHLKNLKTLKLTNQTGAEGEIALAEILHGSGITSLNLEGCKIGDEGAIALAEILHGSKITSLNLRGCEIGDEGARELAKALARPRPGYQVTELSLRENQIGYEAVIEIVQKLPELRLLDLGDCNIGPEGVMRIVQILPVELTALDLGACNIRSEGVVKIVQNLPAKLTSLCLSNNRIRAQGAKEIAKYLPKGLRVLDLSFNNIGTTGAEALARVLPNSGIEKLNLEKCTITYNGAIALFKKLTPGLKSLISADSFKEDILKIAISKNDIIYLKTFLEYGSVDIDGSAIWEAVKNANIECAKILLDSNKNKEYCNIKSLDTDGIERTAFRKAVIEGHIECVKAFLDTNKDLITQRGNSDLLPLNSAAGYGHLDVMNELLERGANINDQENDNRYTALMAAVYYEKGDCIESLLKHGANPNLKNKTGFTALMIAVEENNQEIMKILLKFGAIDTNGAAIWMAVKNRNKECVKHLLASNKNREYCNIKFLDTDGIERTAFREAVIEGHIECVKAFLDTNKDLITQRGNSDLLPLNSAAGYGHLDVMNELLERGANINDQENDNRYTALMAAVSFEKGDCIKSLLEHGANPNLQNKTGDTALMIAVKENKLEMVRILLENAKDIDADVEDKDGQTALTILMSAVYYEKGDCIESLLKLHNVYNEKGACIQSLLKHGANPNLKNKIGETALMIAVKENNLEMVRILLENADYIDMDIKDKNGQTALTIADSKNKEILGSPDQHKDDPMEVIPSKETEKILAEINKDILGHSRQYEDKSTEILANLRQYSQYSQYKLRQYKYKRKIEYGPLEHLDALIEREQDNKRQRARVAVDDARRRHCYRLQAQEEKQEEMPTVQ